MSRSRDYIKTISSLFDDLEKRGGYEIDSIKNALENEVRHFRSLKQVAYSSDKHQEKRNIEYAQAIIDTLKDLKKQVKSLGASSKDDEHYEALAGRNKDYEDMDYHDRDVHHHHRK